MENSFEDGTNAMMSHPLRLLQGEEVTTLPESPELVPVQHTGHASCRLALMLLPMGFSCLDLRLLQGGLQQVQALPRGGQGRLQRGLGGAHDQCAALQCQLAQLLCQMHHLPAPAMRSGRCGRGAEGSPGPPAAQQRWRLGHSQLVGQWSCSPVRPCWRWQQASAARLSKQRQSMPCQSAHARTCLPLPC